MFVILNAIEYILIWSCCFAWKIILSLKIQIALTLRSQLCVFCRDFSGSWDTEHVSRAGYVVPRRRLNTKTILKVVFACSYVINVPLPRPVPYPYPRPLLTPAPKVSQSSGSKNQPVWRIRILIFNRILILRSYFSTTKTSYIVWDLPLLQQGKIWASLILKVKPPRKFRIQLWNRSRRRRFQTVTGKIIWILRIPDPSPCTEQYLSKAQITIALLWTALLSSIVDVSEHAYIATVSAPGPARVQAAPSLITYSRI